MLGDKQVHSLESGLLLSFGVLLWDHRHFVQVWVKLSQSNLHRLQIRNELINLSILAAEKHYLRPYLPEIVSDFAPALLIYQFDSLTRWLLLHQMWNIWLRWLLVVLEVHWGHQLLNLIVSQVHLWPVIENVLWGLFVCRILRIILAHSFFHFFGIYRRKMDEIKVFNWPRVQWLSHLIKVVELVSIHIGTLVERELGLTRSLKRSYIFRELLELEDPVVRNGKDSLFQWLVHEFFNF